MRTKRLAVITTHFNPLKKESIHQNYLRFLRDIKTWDVDVFSAEVVYGNAPFPTRDAFIQIRAGKEHLMWQKERLLNLIVEKLPKQYTVIAWIDADILFLDPNWVDRALLAIKYFPVVQLISEILCVDSQGYIKEIILSPRINQNRLTQSFKESPKFNTGHGIAWIAKRSVFPLYEYCILGGGDTACVFAWLQNPLIDGMVKNMPDFKENYDSWAKAAYKKVQGQLGGITGQALHLYHGERRHRKHIQRWDILRRLNYNPAVDIEIDRSNGLLAFSTKANHKLIQEVKNYFISRKE